MRTLLLCTGSKIAYPKWAESVAAALNVYRSTNEWLGVIHGDCPTGVDRMVDVWAEHNADILIRVPALWAQHGRAAGFRRNDDLVKVSLTLADPQHTHLTCAAFPFAEDLRVFMGGTYDTMKRCNAQGVRIDCYPLEYT